MREINLEERIVVSQDSRLKRHREEYMSINQDLDINKGRIAAIYLTAGLIGSGIIYYLHSF